MEGLEKLRPFVWFCQLGGFFPYRMEVDPVTKRFKRFTFSICHPATFWYFSLTLSQWFSRVLIMHSNEIQEIYNEATAHFSLIDYIFYFTQLFDWIMIYFVVYRLSLMSKAVEYLVLFDRSLESIPNKSFNVTPRIFIGAAYTFVSVCTMYPNRLKHCINFIFTADGNWFVFPT